MSAGTHQSDYDLFDYDYDTPPLRLDEALIKARELRAKSRGDVVYRIVPTNTKGTDFRVIAVPKEEVFVRRGVCKFCEQVCPLDGSIHGI